MKKTFEEPTIECIAMRTESITDESPISGDAGVSPDVYENWGE